MTPTNPTLTIICGPMFAGKTTQLIARIRDWESQSGRVVVVKPSWDHRYRDTNTSPSELISHDNARHPAYEASDAAQVRTLLNQQDVFSDSNKQLLIVLDEAHFFGHALIEVVLDLIKQGVHVIIAGVDLDHRGDPFEPFPSLLAHADQVIKLASRCQVCNASARHSQRMTAGDSRIEVGGSDKYEARCRNCFKPKHAARP